MSKFKVGDKVDIGALGEEGIIQSVNSDLTGRTWYEVVIDSPNIGHWVSDFFESELYAIKDKDIHLPSGYSAAFKEDGLCPKCGEKGYFSNFQFCCSKHGPY